MPEMVMMPFASRRIGDPCKHDSCTIHARRDNVLRCIFVKEWEAQDRMGS